MLYAFRTMLLRIVAVLGIVISGVLSSEVLAGGVSSDGTNWGGGYWGLHVGYGSGDVSTSMGNGGKESIGGFIIGAHAGNNHQFIPGLMLGFEVDGEYSAIDASCSLILFDWDCELTGLFSVRGRAGVVQRQQYLPFVTAGFSYALAKGEGGSLPGFGTVIGGGIEFPQKEFYRPRIEALYYSLFGFGLTDADLFVVRTGINF